MAITLVQTKTGDNTNATSLSVTLTSPTTAGNCLVVCVGVGSASGTPTVTGVKLGGVVDNFAQAVQESVADSVAAIWTDQNCAGGQTSVAITESGAATAWEVSAVVFEFSGLATSSAVDKTSVGTGTSTAFNSGTTATTTLASELFVGLGTAGNTVTGPSSPWTNTGAGGTAVSAIVAGWQVVSSTGTTSYSGTVATSSKWTATVITLKGSVVSIFPSVFNTQQAVRTAAYF